MPTEPKPASTSGHPLQVLDLGLVDYRTALDIQTDLRERRIANLIPDTLLLLEHPPVITLGRSGSMENVLVPESQLAERGVRFFHSNRGGDVTYHGPGQVVGYAIMDLTRHTPDLRKHLRKLEEVLILALADLGVSGVRRDGETGVWVGENKIASIGIHVKRWVTMHGFALNLSPDFDHLSLINHCGITDAPMTSIEKVLSRPIPGPLVLEALTRAFCRVFNLIPVEVPTPSLTSP